VYRANWSGHGPDPRLNGLKPRSNEAISPNAACFEPRHDSKKEVAFLASRLYGHRTAVVEPRRSWPTKLLRSHRAMIAVV